MKLLIDISDDLYTRAGCDDDVLYDIDAMIEILDVICGGKVLSELSNGEVLKTLFPNIVKTYTLTGYSVFDGDDCIIYDDWWEMPYKGEEE